MNTIMTLFFGASILVGAGCLLVGGWNLVTRNGNDRENALWVARGTLILGLAWLVLQ